MTVAPSRPAAPVRSSGPGPSLRAVLDAALDAVILMDDDGVIRFWNRQAEALLGWTAAEAVGRSFSSLIDPERTLLWNGSVEVKPRTEGGTRVTVRLPLPANGASA